MKAIIAEKPSVARQIALVLGASKNEGGYYSGNGYLVTWALGHLVGLAMPEDYGLQGFRTDSLPILPEPFLLTVRKKEQGGKYITDTIAAKQLGIIKRVIDKADSLVVATDAGREGELIFRYIYTYLKCHKPFSRLWVSSLTEKALKKGFENLMPGIQLDPLYHAAMARSRADWMVGINATQALSSLGDGSVYSLGRVQTPTLALVCRRYREHEGFTAESYWQLRLSYQKSYIEFTSLSNSSWKDKKEVLAIQRSIERSGLATVDRIENRPITEDPPLLFDLTGLQKQANKELGFSAEETLGIAQSLYEKKFITYPRTGSRHIPADMWEEVPCLLEALEIMKTFREHVIRVRLERLTKNIVDDLKVTDHHGLLITDRTPSALTAKENAIYEMIAYRFLEALSQPCRKQSCTAKLSVLHHEFTYKGLKIESPGWRGIRKLFTVAGEIPAEDFPLLDIGEQLKIRKSEILEKKTQAPSLYTEAALLEAMEHAGRETDDLLSKKALQHKGIGTPATRAAIIETLLKRNYLQREKRLLIPTQKGLQVYCLVQDMLIADVSMTAQWEMQLQRIEEKDIDPAAFQQEIERYARNVTEELLALTPIVAAQPELLCPQCQKQNLKVRDNIVRCPDTSCNWLQYRNVCGVYLDIDEIENLIGKGTTSLFKGLRSRSGKVFNACLVLGDNGKVSFEFGR